MSGILAVGDSITLNCWPELELDGTPAHAWVDWIGAALDSDVTRIAFGGATSATIRRKLDETTLDGSFDLALIYVGVNNIASPRAWSDSSLADDLGHIVRRAATVSESVVVLGYPVSLGRSAVPFAYGPGVRRRVDEANEIVRRVAADNNAITVQPNLERPTEVFLDGIHPTSAGHLAMAQAVLDVVLAGTDASATDTRSVPPPVDHDAWRRKFFLRFALTRPPRALASWAVGLRTKPGQ